MRLPRIFPHFPTFSQNFNILGSEEPFYNISHAPLAHSAVVAQICGGKCGTMRDDANRISAS